MFPRQAGFSIVVAVFILVVMSLLAATMLRVQQADSAGTAQDTLSVRAFYAAESGAQFAMNRIFLDGANCGTLGLPGGAANWSDAAMLQCSVAGLSCQSDSLGGVTTYRLISTAECRSGGGDQFVARRSIEVKAATP